MSDKWNPGNEPAGGVAWLAGNVKFIDAGFKKDLGNFRAHEKGLEVGRMTQPHSAAPITDEHERSLMSLSDRHRAALSGAASKIALGALDVIKRRPNELNAEAQFAKGSTEWKALRTATIEKAKPAVQRLNEALGELNHFEALHRRGRLGEFDYSEDSTILKPLAQSGFAVICDAGLNIIQFVPVMPAGVPQAVAIALVMSGAMGIAGAFAGTAVRFWSYRERVRGLIWVVVGSASTLAAMGSATLFAQYRAVLENVARSGGEPNLDAICTTSPTIMSVTVFIAATAVFLFTAMKFRGGRGSPWAAYGDHARFDREVRKATQRVDGINRSYFRNVREIAADVLNNFEEVHTTDRAMLQAAYGARDKAKLQIRDLQKSDEAYFNLTLIEVQRFRDGVMAVRPELLPEQFKVLPKYAAQEFPDTSELDSVVAEAEATFAARTEQLAKLETEVGKLEHKAMEEFPALMEEIMHAGEAQRRRERQARRVPEERVS